MIDEVKMCVDAKINCITENFSIPSEIEGEVSSFFADTAALGERCSCAVEFEEKFVSTGLVERFNAIFPKCLPKPKKMTKEEKKNSVKTTKEILLANKKEIAQDAVLGTAQRIVEHKRDDLLTENRERMIENGTYADHTIRTNQMGDAIRVGHFLKNIIKK